MADLRRAAGAVARLIARGARGVAETWRLLSPEQRVAGVGATLLIVSTFGPFSFVEAAIVLIGVAVLALLRMRALGREFHLPFGDGSVIAAAGLWCALLIVVRILDRPLGLNLLALGCALLLFLAGARERANRPADDMPAEREQERDRTESRRRRLAAGVPAAPGRSSEAPTQAAGGRGGSIPEADTRALDDRQTGSASESTERGG